MGVQRIADGLGGPILIEVDVCDLAGGVDRLISLAREGRKVVRLGPHPGEAEALRAAGIRVELV